MSEAETNSAAEQNEVIVERTITASSDAAYEAWSSAEKQSAWFTTVVRHDLKVGGRYSNADGDCGVFREIVPNRRLRFSWEQPCHSPGSEVTIEFEPVDTDVVNVRLTHTNITRSEDASDLVLGWEWALDSLKSYLETGSGIAYRDWEAMKEMGV
jgi:uncharacterized protein YndB with AHSA1/START domain